MKHSFETREIALNDIPDVIEKLHDEGLVQTHGDIGRVIGFLGRPFAENRDDRIDWHHPPDEKRDEEKPQHRHGDGAKRFRNFDQNRQKGRRMPPFFDIDICAHGARTISLPASKKQR